MSARSVVGVVVAGVAGMAVGLALVACRSSDERVGPVVQFHNTAASVRVRPGETVQLSLGFEIAKGHHIQANPAAQKTLVPASVELAGPAALTLGQPVYPPGHAFELEGSDWDLSTYDGRLTITVPVSATAGITPGDHTIEGWFSYQACNRQSCLRPDRLAIAITVRVPPAQP